MFLFGVSYAVVSLSCTIGLFISAVSNAFTTDGFVQGVGSFLAYSLGMGTIILFLTVSLARAKNNVATNMRRLLPFMGTVSGSVLVIAGIYLIDYGVWEIRIQDDLGAPNLLVDQFETFQAAVSNWIVDATPERIGVLTVVLIAGLYLLAWFEDNPGDRLRQGSLTVVWAAVVLFLEAFNSFDFLIARSDASWRTGRSASATGSPIRSAAASLSGVFVAMVALWAYRKADNYRRPCCGHCWSVLRSLRSASCGLVWPHGVPRRKPRTHHRHHRAEVAERTGSSYYGVIQAAPFRQHIPSTKFDPTESDALAAFVGHVDTVIAVHGYGRDDHFWDVLLGGRNRELATHLAGHLRADLDERFGVLDVVDEIPGGLRGQHARNPVNLPINAGVQMELPPTIRWNKEAMNWSDHEGTPRAPQVDALIETLVVAVETWQD